MSVYFTDIGHDRNFAYLVIFSPVRIEARIVTNLTKNPQFFEAVLQTCKIRIGKEGFTPPPPSPHARGVVNKWEYRLTFLSSKEKKRNKKRWQTNLPQKLKRTDQSDDPSGQICVNFGQEIAYVFDDYFVRVASIWIKAYFPPWTHLAFHSSYYGGKQQNQLG